MIPFLRMVLHWIRTHGPALRQATRMAAAATMAMAVVELFRLPSGFWAPLSALTVLQSQIGASFVAARNYVIATVTGVLLGALIVATLGTSLVFAAVAIFMIASLATLMRLPPASAATASAIVPVLVLAVQGNPWRYGAYRILDILIGMAAALVVSYLFFPTRAVDQLRLAVAGAITDATGLAAGAVRDLIEAKPADAQQADTEARAATRLQTAQGLLAAARLEPLHSTPAHDLLPYYLSHGQRILEHASAVIDFTEGGQPRAAIAGLTAPMGSVSDKLREAGVALAGAVTAGIAGERAPVARSALEALCSALNDLRAINLSAMSAGEDLLRIHSLIMALDDLAAELDRSLLRIEDPEQSATPEERARLTEDLRAHRGLSVRRRRPSTAAVTPSAEPPHR